MFWKILRNPLLLYQKRDRIPILLSHHSHRALVSMLAPKRWLAAHTSLRTANDRRLFALRGRHPGRRAFIIGNGPSLRASDLDKLQGEITFAANKIYLIYDKTVWRTTYHLVDDEMVAEQIYPVLNDLPFGTKLIGWNPGGKIKKDETRIHYDLIIRHNKGFPNFSDDPRMGIAWGASVCYSMLQFARFMGCTELYLLGVDFSFSVPSHAVAGRVMGGGEVNHFSPDYRPAGEQWAMPDLDRQERAFTFARDYLAERGVRVFNATHGGKLEVFERIDFDSLFPAKPANK